MIYVYPDFYFDFECKAGECLHSCCKDWEIDIDEDSLTRFKDLPKNEANEILRNISGDEYAHFNLCENGNCPFLEDSGLCKLIIKYGEDFVPYICREHPRFYNEYDSYCECGLGLSCEKTVELLCDEDYLDFIFQDDVQDVQIAYETEFINRKYDLIDDIGESDDVLLPLRKNGLTDAISFDKLIRAFSDIETLSGNWNKMLLKLNHIDSSNTVILYCDKSLRAFTQYLVFRHMHDAGEDATALFIACSSLICSLLIDAGFDIHDVIREFSSEIEYSDENIDRIKTALHS